MNSISEDIVGSHWKKRKSENQKNKASCGPLSVPRIISVIILILGIIFPSFGIQFYARKVFQLDPWNMVYIWLLWQWIFHLGPFLIILFCFISSFIPISFKTWIFEKNSMNHYSAAIFKPFRRLLGALIVKGILLSAYFICYMFLTSNYYEQLAECTEDSFEKYRKIELIVVSIASFLPYTMIVDTFLVGECSAFNETKFKDILRMLFCWRIHSREKFDNSKMWKN